MRLLVIFLGFLFLPPQCKFRVIPDQNESKHLPVNKTDIKLRCTLKNRSNPFVTNYNITTIRAVRKNATTISATLKLTKKQCTTQNDNEENLKSTTLVSPVTETSIINSITESFTSKNKIEELHGIIVEGNSDNPFIRSNSSEKPETTFPAIEITTETNRKVNENILGIFTELIGTDELDFVNENDEIKTINKLNSLISTTEASGDEFYKFPAESEDLVALFEDSTDSEHRLLDEYVDVAIDFNQSNKSELNIKYNSTIVFNESAPLDQFRNEANEEEIGHYNVPIELNQTEQSESLDKNKNSKSIWDDDYSTISVDRTEGDQKEIDKYDFYEDYDKPELCNDNCSDVLNNYDNMLPNGDYDDYDTEESFNLEESSKSESDVGSTDSYDVTNSNRVKNSGETSKDFIILSNPFSETSDDRAVTNSNMADHDNNTINSSKQPSHLLNTEQEILNTEQSDLNDLEHQTESVDLFELEDISGGNYYSSESYPTDMTDNPQNTAEFSDYHQITGNIPFTLEPDTSATDATMQVTHVGNEDTTASSHANVVETSDFGDLDKLTPSGIEFSSPSDDSSNRTPNNLYQSTRDNSDFPYYDSTKDSTDATLEETTDSVEIVKNSSSQDVWNEDTDTTTGNNAYQTTENNSNELEYSIIPSGNEFSSPEDASSNSIPNNLYPITLDNSDFPYSESTEHSTDVSLEVTTDFVLVSKNLSNQNVSNEDTDTTTPTSINQTTVNDSNDFEYSTTSSGSEFSSLADTTKNETLNGPFQSTLDNFNDSTVVEINTKNSTNEQSTTLNSTAIIQNQALKNDSNSIKVSNNNSETLDNKELISQEMDDTTKISELTTQSSTDSSESGKKTETGNSNVSQTSMISMIHTTTVPPTVGNAATSNMSAYGKIILSPKNFLQMVFLAIGSIFF